MSNCGLYGLSAKVCVYVVVQYSSRTFSISFLKAIDVAVGLQAGEKDVEEPQTQEQQAGQEAGHLRAAELSADRWPTSEQEHSHADESEDGKKCDREGQWTGFHLELLPLDFPVDGGHWPGHSDPQEHIDSVTAGDISNRRISVLVLHGSHFASKCVWDEREK